jgi:hypothetical protein
MQAPAYDIFRKDAATLLWVEAVEDLEAATCRIRGLAAQSVIARIHWLLENGTLPLDDRTQVRKILSWGDAFYREVRRCCQTGTVENAAELIQAASAAAHSAEHVCRKWYVTHTGRLDMEIVKPQT